MKRVDRRRWQSARTLAELGQLTALWLEGQLASQPGYQPNCGPDEETHELVAVLARLNRAGWLTDVSQPGEGPVRGDDGATWCQRAGVGGFAAPELADRITAAATAAGLLVIRHAGASRPPEQDPVVVTTRADQPVTEFGSHSPPEDLDFQYAECSAEARAEICAAVQLTVVDPQWGRTELLWSLLEQFLITTADAGRS